MASQSRRIVERLMRLALAVAVLVLLYDSWRAVVEESGANQLVVPFQSGRDGEAEVFYDAGAGLRQEDSAKIATTASAKLRELAFAVPRVPLREIRFDPFTGAGDFRIGAPRLVSAIGRVIEKFPLAAIKPRNEIGPWRREGDEWIGSTVPGAQDPQLTVILSAPTPVGRVRLPWLEAAVVALLTGVVSVLAGRRREH